MIFPAAPVELTALSQLRGLETGEFILQWKYDGRRGISIPGEPLRYKSGKRVNAKPWKHISIPESDLILDMELMRHSFHLLDIIADAPFMTRVMSAATRGLYIPWLPVRSIADINMLLREALASEVCDGVVLKRTSAVHVGSQHGQPICYDWLKVKKVIVQ